MATTSKKLVKIASACEGKIYGHVPGHQYHDVYVTIFRRAGGYRCCVAETWGSCQGYDEEHGRREVSGRGESIHGAVEDARRLAENAGIDEEYLTTALSSAEDEAEDAE